MLFYSKNYELAFMKKIWCVLLMSKLRDPGILPAPSPCCVTAASLVLTQWQTRLLQSMMLLDYFPAATVPIYDTISLVWDSSAFVADVLLKTTTVLSQDKGSSQQWSVIPYLAIHALGLLQLINAGVSSASEKINKLIFQYWLQLFSFQRNFSPK